MDGNMDKDSQNYQFAKVDITNAIVTKKTMTLGELSRNFDVTFLIDILSDLEIEGKVKRIDGPPTKYQYIENLNRQNKKSLSNNQNSRIGAKVYIGPIKKPIYPYYEQYKKR